MVLVFFFPVLSICLLIERNTPLRNILLTYVNLDMEQNTLQPFLSLEQGLHNFESVFIPVFIRDCSQAELELTVTAS